MRISAIEFLGLWESLNNMNFNSDEFDRMKSEAGYNSFTLSPKKWVEKTEAIGMIAKGGRYGGAFAHTDIAFEFASWISAEFKMYVIQDYKRLKSDENSKLSLDVRGTLSAMTFFVFQSAATWARFISTNFFERCKPLIDR